jgi:hypothetical protein
MISRAIKEYCSTTLWRDSLVFFDFDVLRTAWSVMNRLLVDDSVSIRIITVIHTSNMGKMRRKIDM